MSFFKKESFENSKSWTAAAIVVGAGVIGYVGYKYYKDTLKGGKNVILNPFFQYLEKSFLLSLFSEKSVTLSVL